MALAFQAVKRANSKVAGGVTEEFRAEFDEAWEFFKNTEGEDLTVDFPTVAERDKWVRTARAHADASGLRFRAVSAEKDSGRLVFRIETQEQYESRKAEREAYQADLAERRARGEVIKPGRKAA